MKQKRRYYRTAALLGPQDAHVYPQGRRSVRAEPRSLHIPWRLLVPTLIVVGFGAWMALGDVWYLMWDDLKVTGIFSAQMEREVKLASDLLGWHRFHLHPAAAEEAILAHIPEFAAVDVSCGLIPTSCEIAVTERVPVLVWQAEGEAKYWVDRQGYVYPARSERPDLPVVRGSLPPEGGAHSIASIQQGLAALATLGVPTMALEYSSERGLIWTDPAGRRVAFGAGSEMAPRWKMYEVLVAHLASQGITPQCVDVRFPGAATYSLDRAW
ncbi:MAG: cell division protein FtsQ/DivIB [Anaerolineae bacterium]|nr:cell division protein FtsQ/DivIB [Anaerolineae bacterium]